MSGRPPDLTTMDAFFWGFVKDKVCATKRQKTKELKEATYYVFEEIDFN